jgi:hypothetical protein
VLHLAPFACVATLDDASRLVTPTDRLLMPHATTAHTPYHPRALAAVRRHARSLAVSADGSLLFTVLPPTSAATSGAVLVWRMHAPPPTRAPLPLTRTATDPSGVANSAFIDDTHLDAHLVDTVPPPSLEGEHDLFAPDDEEMVALALADGTAADADGYDEYTAPDDDNGQSMRLVPLRSAAHLPHLGALPAAAAASRAAHAVSPALASADAMPLPAVGGAGGDVVCALGALLFIQPARHLPMRLYAGHDAQVSALAVHPSGGVVASGQPGAVRVWSLASTQTLAVLGARGSSHAGPTQ